MRFVGALARRALLGEVRECGGLALLRVLVEGRAARSGGLLVGGVGIRRFELAQSGVQQGLGAQLAARVIRVVVEFE